MSHVANLVPSDTKLHNLYRKPRATISNDEIAKLNRPFSFWGKLILVCFFLLYLFLIWELTVRGGQWYLLGGLMFFYLVIKKCMALFYLPNKSELTKDYKVTALITTFNEDPESVVGILDNLLELDHPLHEIVLVDDGSDEDLTYRVAQSFADDHQEKNGVQFQIIRLSENVGKFEALKRGFEHVRSDYVFLVDSDCQIMPNALTELLRPFEDDKTSSTVGNIGILNVKENFLTRLQSLKYFGAFQMGRAAQSMTGDVIVCSGAFSLHKMDFIKENLHDIEPVRFAGITVSSGDDRQLTAFSRLLGGKTRYQSTAYCKTEAPTTWRKFLAQRRRWQRSSYIVTLAFLKRMFVKRPVFSLWALAESYFWLITTIIFVIAVLNRGFYLDLRDLIIYFLAISAAHAGFYLLYKPMRFLLFPLFSLAYGLFLIVVRLYTAFTIGNDSWGTRTRKEQGALETAN